MIKSRHEDDHAVVKHREQLFARFCAELVRESGNRASFDQAKARILGSREILNDPALFALVKSYIAEREVAIGLAARSANHKRVPVSRVAPVLDKPIQSPERLHQEASDRLQQFDRQFHDMVLHFKATAAQRIYQNIVSLLAEHVELTPGQILDDYKLKLDRMVVRRKEFHHRIDLIAQKTAAAIKAGDHDAAARAVRRFSSIHALYPQLLSERRFTRLRELIMHASDEGEHRAAAQNLIERERAVAAELRNLAAKIHQFHELARTLPHNSAAYHQAEAEYHHVIDAVKAHDKEWLAGLVIEFVDLLAEMGDRPSKRAARQVDHFVASLRSALAKLESQSLNND